MYENTIKDVVLTQGAWGKLEPGEEIVAVLAQSVHNDDHYKAVVRRKIVREKA